MLFNPILRSVARAGARRVPSGSARQATTSAAKVGPGVPASVLGNWYKFIGKSNVTYVTWIIGGVLAGEVLWGFGTDAVWASANKGRTFDTIDWTKFKSDDDDDDDDDDGDDDEDDDDEEGGDDDDDDDDE